MTEATFPILAKYLGSVHFDEGSAEIKDKKELDEFINRYDLYVKQEYYPPEHRVKVLHYSDPEQALDTLSLARMKAVIDYLISAGVATDRMDDPFPLSQERPLKEGELEQHHCEIAFMCYYVK